MTQNVRAGGCELNQVTHNIHIVLQYAFNGEITPVLKFRFFHGNLLLLILAVAQKHFVWLSLFVAYMIPKQLTIPTVTCIKYISLQHKAVLKIPSISLCLMKKFMYEQFRDIHILLNVNELTFFLKCTFKSGSCIKKYLFRLGQAKHEMGWYNWASIKPQLVCLNPWQGCKADCLSARSAHVSQKHSICVEVNINQLWMNVYSISGVRSPCVACGC